MEKLTLTPIKADKLFLGKPFCTIGRNSLRLSSAACGLLENASEYQYAKLYTATMDKKTVVVVEFLKDEREGALRIQKSGRENGITISNKSVMSQAFGAAGTADNTEQRDVLPYEHDKNMLIILP